MTAAIDQPTSPPELEVLAIEPESAKADHLRLAIEPFEAKNSLTPLRLTILTTVAELELRPTTAPPALILLHATMNDRGWSYESFLAVLKARNWTTRTVLHTGDDVHAPAAQRLRDSRDKSGALALFARPLPWDRLESWARDEGAMKDARSAAATTPAVNDREIGKLANLLAPGVMVLHQAPVSGDWTVLWGNDAARSVNGGQLTDSDVRRLDLLSADLTADSAKAIPTRRARRLDWDRTRAGWVECRLHALDKGRYWYTRDWRDGEAVDEEFAHFEERPYFITRFGRLCDYLAERWGFSRIRLYQIDQAPEGLVRFGQPPDEDARHELPQLVVVGDSHAVIPWLVVPRAQSGGGLSKTEDLGAEAALRNWWLHRYTWAASVDASPASAEARKRIELGGVGLKPVLLLEEAQAPCAPESVPVVDWGPAKQHRLFAVLPYVSGRPAAQAVPSSLHTLLVMDRRHDHLSDLASALTDDRERKRIQSAARAGHLSLKLTEEAKEAFEHGPFARIAPLVGRWLMADHERRVAKWHQDVTQAILSNFGRHNAGGGMQAIAGLCADLKERWPTLWEHERGHVCMGSEPSDSPILNWFFAVQRSDRHIEVPAGAGKVWERYCREAQVLPFDEPLRTLLADELPAWTMHVIQDRSASLRARRQPLAEEYRPFEEDLSPVRCWVAIKLPRQLGFDRAAMVVHFGQQGYPLHATVLHLLVIAAQRLYPPFLLAQTEAHERSQWAAAVVHELKTEALLLQGGLHRLAKTLDTKRDPHADLGRLDGSLETMLSLCHDYLRNLDDRFEAPDARELEPADLSFDLLVERTIAPWRDRYPDVKLDVQSSIQVIRVVAPTLLRNVLRVLLHNAFRHGQSWVRLEAAIEGVWLRVKVSNDADSDTVAQLQSIEMHGENAKRAGFVRLRVGLRSARALAREVEGQIDAPKILEQPAMTGDAGTHEVEFGLKWPLERSTD